MQEEWSQVLKEKTEQHPCYFAGGHQYARMHLPVAPRCNIQCNYCNRKYDCLHESRPGVTSAVLTPQQALEKYKYVKERLPNLKVVGIAGPGDALYNFEETYRSFALIKAYDPEVTFCLSTNGLLLPEYADELDELGVTHFTVTLNTLDPQIGAQIYRMVSYRGKLYSGEEGAALLLERQLEGLKKLQGKQVVVKINTVLIPGINEEHIPQVVKAVKTYGVYVSNIMPLIPAEGTAFAQMPLVSNQVLNQLRKQCGQDLKQMYHCRQCRADAIGVLGEDISFDFRPVSCQIQHQSPAAETGSKSFRVAVASKTGRLVDQHFGHAEGFYVYEHGQWGSRLIERRSVDQYCQGGDSCGEQVSPWEKILAALADCQRLICMRIGAAPKKALEEKGIQVLEVYDRIEQAIERAANH